MPGALAQAAVVVLLCCAAIIDCDPASPHPRPRPSASGPAPSHSSHAPSSSYPAPPLYGHAQRHAGLRQPLPSESSPAPSYAGHAPSTPSPAFSVPSPAHSTASPALFVPSPAHSTASPAPPVASYTPSAQGPAHPTPSPALPLMGRAPSASSPAPLTAGNARLNASPAPYASSPAPKAPAPPPQLVLGAVGSTVELPCHNAEPAWIEPRWGRWHRGGGDSGGGGGDSGGGGGDSGGGGGAASSSEAPPDRRGAFWSWISRDGRHRGQVIADVYPRGSARRYLSPLRPRAAMRRGRGAFLLGDFSLRLGPLRPGDAGAFTCRLHEAGSGRRDYTRTLRLETVQVVPSHRGPFSPRSPLALSCALSHWPQPRPPRVTWSLRGLPLAMGPQPRHRRRLGDGGRSVAIRRLRLDDAGAWACHVTAPGGATATATFDLRFRDDGASPAKGGAVAAAVTTGPLAPTARGCRPDAAPERPPPMPLLAPGLLIVGMAAGAGLALIVVVVACRRSRARNDGTRP
ncbi:uncharacterized protein LOC142923839 [Petromyzon marinus]|uniref:uncharacterized protein LOC142923839 n=1 Tax=Petromyzon marinus TaxID=7757 RepID=UPI003F7297EC